MVEWRNIGSAFESCQSKAGSRRQFGPEGIKEFYNLCDALEIKRHLNDYSINEIYSGVIPDKER
ncbi:hypothetical protein [Hahella sp. HN01]|uniref:hypothetical protein n=1 Tax=Hahella sp. HN01 TaxID=2847262 RepID=UPI0020A64703|nr:hypothetical protein [Hahella sp. HN01]